MATKKNQNRVVIAIFRNRDDISRAVDGLKMAGFRNADISALLPTPESTKEFAHTKETKAPEGASVGGVSGAVLGGTLGWLAGIGSITIPGLGALVAAGPIMAALAGAGAVGVAGGLAGAPVGLGVPEYEAARYEGFVKEGGMLLSVHADNKEWQERAEEILKSCGGLDVSTTKEKRSDSASEVEEDTPRMANTRY